MRKRQSTRELAPESASFLQLPYLTVRTEFSSSVNQTEHKHTPYEWDIQVPSKSNPVILRLVLCPQDKKQYISGNINLIANILNFCSDKNGGVPPFLSTIYMRESIASWDD
jgi:hypothetical protein